MTVMKLYNLKIKLKLSRHGRKAMLMMRIFLRLLENLLVMKMEAKRNPRKLLRGLLLKRKLLLLPDRRVRLRRGLRGRPRPPPLRRFALYFSKWLYHLIIVYVYLQKTDDEDEEDNEEEDEDEKPKKKKRAPPKKKGEPKEKAAPKKRASKKKKEVGCFFLLFCLR